MVQDVLTPGYTERRRSRLGKGIQRLECYPDLNHAQRFLSAHSRIHNHCQLRRHLLTADQHRATRDAAFRTWSEVVGAAPAA